MSRHQSRRRFLQIFAAGCLCATQPATAIAGLSPIWQGRGFGADLSLILEGDGDRRAVLEGLPSLITRIEAEFSLHDPGSALSRLNADGRLQMSKDFAALMDQAEWLHRQTGGAFDPSVQALWLARARGEDHAETGFHRVLRKGRRVFLPDGMALTFNGLAQGFAADAVAALLRSCGFATALVNMGEFAGLGGPWRIGIEDPTQGILAERQITESAIATSSPMATLIGGKPHLMHPRGLPPLWSTISIEAQSATLADGLSTAAVFHDATGLQDLADRLSGVHRITAVSFSGDLSSFTPRQRTPLAL